jgi:hypothetical protein
MSRRMMFARALGGSLAALTLAAWSPPAGASLIVTSTISRQQFGPNSYEYSVSLTNTGDTPVGTLWFGWFPSYDQLTAHPTSITSPAGWTGVDAPDDFGIASVQWVNTTSPLQPGKTLSGFKFDTPESDVTTGTNFFGVPIDETYVYIGAPETDPGYAFTPTVVTTPEPASAALAAAGALLLLRRGRRRARAVRG